MQCIFALIAAVIVPINQSAAQAQSVVPRETAVAPQTQVLSIRNVTVRLDIPDASFRVGTAELTAWVERSAQIVADYYGRFPSNNLQLRVLTSEGRGVQGGTTCAQMKDAPVTPNLAAFWQSLGIERDGRSVTFRDDAPLAATREAIMRPPSRQR